ncbi:MAG: class I SAM-dependent methyltransferase [Pseudomonadota bacterium]
MNDRPSIAVQASDPALDAQAHALAGRLHCPHLHAGAAGEHSFLLAVTPEHLELRQTGPEAPGPIYVDFLGGAVGHRRRFGGGKHQPIARAVGLGKGPAPSVVDATAGLGRDAFVLACLGCKVTLVERSAVIAALVEDGLQRAARDAEIGALVTERMQLVQADSIDYLRALAPAQRPEVVYLDPMYPHRKKSALVKKEMRIFRALVGDDPDHPQLLAAALACAGKRVVVKRPKGAPEIEGPKPTMAIVSEHTRFDVYVIAALHTRPD